MPNLLLIGPTNNGKTMIIEKFRRAHPVIPAKDHVFKKEWYLQA